MSRLARLLILASLLGFSMGLAGAATAEGPAVTQFVSIDTKGNNDALLSYAASNEKIFKRLGIKATRRYIQASLAGDFSGTLAVVIEYPSLIALAEAQAKLSKDAEWQKYIDAITDSGMIVESNSLWVDVTP